jgi:putative nucleotidyltransferase-like protein
MCERDDVLFLLDCLARPERLDDIGNSACVHRGIESWNRLFLISSRHAIVPLIERRLARSASVIVPSDVQELFRASSQQGALRSLRLSGDLVTVMRAFANANVAAAPFKGPTLATLLYGDLSLRQFEDLDILVHRADADRARAVLVALGYTAVVPLSDDQRGSLRRSGHHEQMALPSGTLVELHWSLNNRAFTRDSFEHYWWENQTHLSIGGMSMPTLGVEQLLLYLCLHGGKHSWARLSWLCDLQRALQTYPGADWGLVWRLAREAGGARMVSIGLSLVESLLDGASLTASARRAGTSDSAVEEISALIAERLRSGESGEREVDFGVQLRARERWRDQLRYTSHVLATPHQADVSLWGLPRMLHGVYYVVRPLRLLWKHVARRLRPMRAARARTR